MSTTATDSVVSANPGVVSGTPVFRGTRVPVQTLFDHLADTESLEAALDDFLEGFPPITREMAMRAIEEAGQALVERHCARPA